MSCCQKSPTYKPLAAILSVLLALVAIPARAGASVVGSAVELGGQTRYETAAEQALYSHPSSDWVIVASGESYVDALASASLAGALDCPILLTTPSRVPDVTLATISQVGAKNIIVLGGTSAVSEAAQSQLAQLGTVTRLGGQTRYETQLEILEYGRNQGFFTGGQVFIASGESFADVLSASPLLYALQAPVFFANGSGQLSAQELAALGELGATDYTVVGGSQVVSDAGYAQVNSIAMTNGGTIRRCSGDTRYETSIRIATYAVESCGFTWDGVAFASGQSPYDSLGGGVVQGEGKSVLILATNNNILSMAQRLPSTLVKSSVKFFGGTDVFSGSSRSAVCSHYGLTYSSGTPIMGSSKVTAAQLASYYRSVVGDSAYPAAVYASKGAPTIDDWCSILVEEANSEGVRAEVMFVQSMKETNWLRFTGNVRADQCNFAGLGAVDSNPTDANTFPDVRTGLRAQAQHLKAYASTLPLNNACVDVRFHFVTRGCAPYIENLSGRWASSSTYGQSMVSMINEMFKHI